jgi:poly(A) polymerase Pap1
VLRDLQDIVDRWAKKLTLQHVYHPDMVEEATALLLPFGSYRFGVHGRGSDIDALVVGPSFVDRNGGFFGALADTEAVANLQLVPGAHVPVMKMRFRVVQVDLVYARAWASPWCPGIWTSATGPCSAAWTTPPSAASTACAWPTRSCAWSRTPLSAPRCGA